MTRRRADAPRWLAALACVAGLGCGESHGPPDAFNSRRDARLILDTSGPIAFPEIASDRRLVDLDEEDWDAVCEWRSTLRPIPAGFYYCTEEGVNCFDDPTCGVVPHDWTFEECVHPDRGFQQYFPHYAPSCEGTVAQFEECTRAQAEAVCFISFSREREPPICGVAFCDAPP